MNIHPDKPDTWPILCPLYIAHDVGRSRDRSTAVIGGNSPLQSIVTGIIDLRELPENLYGSERASELAKVDRHYEGNALIIADLSHDPTYAESLFDIAGPRVIGLHITRHGDGIWGEWRPVKHGAIRVYTVGRSYLLELLHSKLQARLLKFVDGPMSRKAYQQLHSLERDPRETGVVYTCPAGQHDDLAISCAMLVWAAQHPHQQDWFRSGMANRLLRPAPPKVGNGGWT